jgi:hypothetical protein
LLTVSNSFLKSANCMYEIIEFLMRLPWYRPTNNLNCDFN